MRWYVDRAIPIYHTYLRIDYILNTHVRIPTLYTLYIRHIYKTYICVCEKQDTGGADRETLPLRVLCMRFVGQRNYRI